MSYTHRDNTDEVLSALEKAKKRGDKTENALPAQMDLLHVHTVVSSFPMPPFIII